MITNDDLWTCLAKKENISIAVFVQVCHHFNNILKEMNSSLFDIQHRILEPMDKNHLQRTCEYLNKV